MYDSDVGDCIKWIKNPDGLPGKFSVLMDGRGLKKCSQWQSCLLIFSFNLMVISTLTLLSSMQGAT